MDAPVSSSPEPADNTRVIYSQLNQQAQGSAPGKDLASVAASDSIKPTAVAPLPYQQQQQPQLPQLPNNFNETVNKLAERVDRLEKTQHQALQLRKDLRESKDKRLGTSGVGGAEIARSKSHYVAATAATGHYAALPHEPIKTSAEAPPPLQVKPLEWDVNTRSWKNIKISTSGVQTTTPNRGVATLLQTTPAANAVKTSQDTVALLLQAQK